MQSKIRSLASDTIVYGVSTVLGRFLTFLLTPLYTNFLSASEIGDVAAIYAMIAFVNIVYSLGMESSFMRFWERDEDASNKRVFSVAVVTVVVIGVVVTAITALFASTIASSSFLQLGEKGAMYVAIASLVPLLDALVLIPFARLRMQQRPRVFALLRLVSIVVTVGLNLVFVVAMGMHIEGVLLAGLLGSTATLLFFIPSLRGVLHTVTSEFEASKKLLKEMMRFGLPTVPSNFSSIMVQVADRPIMLMLTGSAMVGMYQTNFRLAIPMMMFVTVFEYAWKPFYLNHRNDPEAKGLFARVFTLFTIVCGALFLMTSLGMPYLVQMPFIGGRFINPHYWSGLGIVPVVMFAYYFNGVFINMAAGFHIEKRTSFFPVATGFAAIVSVAATWFLVPQYGIMGAAWAKVAAYVASAVILYIALRRVYPMPYDMLRVGATLLITGGIYAAAIMLPYDETSRVVAVASAIPAYFLLMFATRILGLSTLRTLIKSVKR
ncbi:MAG: lipopolysaccharide biosynthesis protein [Candidatus Kapabacteria bacterium]|nr:lipopolysaccharide biosynthesis protein [Candidatus Kapabacteria bacterium]